jgi:hypothetical protein
VYDPEWAGFFSFEATTDGAAVAVALPSSGRVLLRATDGSDVTAIGDDRFVRPSAGPRAVADEEDGARPVKTDIIDIPTGTTTPVDPADCANRLSDATTASTYVRLCLPGSGPVLVWQNLSSPTPEAVPVPWGLAPAGARSLMNSLRRTAVVPAAGAIVVARAGDPLVVGFQQKP